MLDAVTLDLGCAPLQTLVLPDASGLEPLVLPGALVARMSVPHDEPALPQEPSPDVVRRFNAVMKPGVPASPLRVLVAAHAAAENPVEREKAPAAAEAERPVLETVEKTVVASGDTVLVEKQVVVSTESPQMTAPSSSMKSTSAA